NIRKLELEVDAKELLSLLDSGLKHPHHDLFVLIHEVSFMLKWEWTVIFGQIPHDANMVAHQLLIFLLYG
ncbi:Proteasome activator complex subunit 4, partial [Bienertia sinuspersici]